MNNDRNNNNINNAFLSSVKMDLHDKEILPGEILPAVIIGKKHTHIDTNTHTYTHRCHK